MQRPYSKTPYFWLEGINAFATTYYFGGLMFLLHREFHLGDRGKLTIGALHGVFYVLGSWSSGRYGQTHGCFKSLRVGFGGMALGIAAGWIFHGFWGQMAALLAWTIAVSFTWGTLEALVCERESQTDLAHHVGLYNVVWAGMAAAGYFVCRWIFEALGASSLYWLPVLLHGAQWLWTFPLERRRKTILAAAPAPTIEEAHHTARIRKRARRFLILARVANPISYMAINTLIVLAPSIGQNAGLDPVATSMWMSIWYAARAAGFAILWHWHGWHFHFGWFAGSFAAVALGFIGMMTAGHVAPLAVAQLLFGWGTACVYSSALFYAMDGSETHAEHGGLHEAILGCGICGGPALSAASLWMAPAHPAAPGWAVGAFLIAGVAGVILAGRRSAMTRP